MHINIDYKGKTHSLEIPENSTLLDLKKALKPLSIGLPYILSESASDAAIALLQTQSRQRPQSHRQ